MTFYVRILTFLIFFLSSFLALAQFEKEFQERAERLNYGKQLLSEGRNELAIETFEPLMVLSPENHAVAAFATYFTGLAYFKRKDYDASKTILQRLLDKFPEWKNKDEAYYLLANIAFEEKKYQSAYQILSKIQLPDLQTDIDGLTKNYLPRAAIDTLKMLYDTYKADKVLPEVLAAKLIYSDNPQDKALVKKILVSSGKEQQDTHNNASDASRKEYNIAVLLPFELDAVNLKSPIRNNQFILDLYQGMSLATNKLEEAGINVNLYAYDTRKDVGTIVNLLKAPELKKMDLLVGPVYAAGTDLIAKFAKNNKVLMFNPLTNNLHWPKNNTYAFMAEPTLETQVSGMAAFADKNFEGKKVAIVFGTSNRDSLLATAYKANIQQRNGKVILFRRVGKNTAGNLIKYLKQAGLDSSSYLFVPNSEPMVQVQLISALQVLQLRTPIITYGSWLESGLQTLEQLESQKVYFINTNYVNPESAEVKSFHKFYTSRFNIIPSEYSYKGYELMWFIGKALAQNPADVAENIRQTGYTNGAFLPGFKYKGATDNQVVPIFKLDKGELKLVNNLEVE